MKPDQERVRSLLTDTITLLCKNGLHFKKQLKVEGLIGVTLDDNEVFIVHLNEIVEDFATASQAIEKDNDKRLQSDKSYPRSEKTNPFQLSSVDSADEGRAESSFQHDSLSGKLEISHSESEVKFSSNSNHSHEFPTASVPVKSEPSDDDLLLIENDSLDMQGSMADSVKEMYSINNSKSNSAFDQRYDRHRSCKRIRPNEPGDDSCLAVANDEFDDGAKTENLESASRTSNFGAMDDYVPPLCSVTTNENTWTRNRRCSNLNPNEARGFGTEGIPNMPWSAIQSRGRNGFLSTGAVSAVSLIGALYSIISQVTFWFSSYVTLRCTSHKMLLFNC